MNITTDQVYKNRTGNEEMTGIIHVNQREHDSAELFRIVTLVVTNVCVTSTCPKCSLPQLQYICNLCSTNQCFVQLHSSLLAMRKTHINNEAFITLGNWHRQGKVEHFFFFKKAPSNNPFWDPPVCVLAYYVVAASFFWYWCKYSKALLLYGIIITRSNFVLSPAWHCLHKGLVFPNSP